MEGLYQLVVQMEDGPWAVVQGLMLAASALLGWLALRAAQTARRIEDVPTSRIGSAPQGKVELSGHADALPGEPIICPLTNTACCWYDYRVEQARRTTHRNRVWQTIAAGRSHGVFLLIDETGMAAVDPDDAEMILDKATRWSGHGPRPLSSPVRGRREWITLGSYRYYENLIMPGDPLYVLGHLHTERGADDLTPEAELRDLLGRWKRDKAKLLRQFDANRDGQIDMDEWEQVRAAAKEAVRASRREHAGKPGLEVISRPPDGSSYLISNLGQRGLVRRLRWQGAGWFLLAIGLVVLMLWLGEQRVAAESAVAHAGAVLERQGDFLG